MKADACPQSIRVPSAIDSAAALCQTFPMTTKSIALAGVLSLSLSAFAADYTVHTWKKIQLSDLFWSEGANIGDFNHDGKMDVVSGPYWWEGPDFKVRHEYYPAAKSWALGALSKIPVPGFEGGLGH